MAKRHIDYYLDIINKKSGSGGGGQSVTVEQLNVSANGTYTAQSGHAYSPVVVNTPTPKTEDVLNVSANGTYTPKSGHTYSEVNVNVPSSGGVVDVERKDINFFSWDGHRIMSFTKAEVDAMTELPPVPVVEGFTNGVWNWTIEQLHNHDGKANVGPYYDYAGTASKLVFDIEYATVAQVSLTADVGTVTIDWGDGSPVESVSVETAGQSAYRVHTYQPGKYEMLIDGNAVCLTWVDPVSAWTEAYFAAGHSIDTSNQYFPEQAGIKRMIGGGPISYAPLQLEFYVYHPDCTAPANIPYAARHLCFGGKVSSLPDESAWLHCSALEEIYTGFVTSMPIIDGYNNTNYDLWSLTDVSIRCDAYEDLAFRRCLGLRAIVIPTPVTTIGEQAFNRGNIYYFEFPATLQTIENGFDRMFGLKRVRFNGLTPPAVASSRAFWNGTPPEGAVIEVPAEALDAYKAATNLSRFADIMEGF